MYLKSLKKKNMLLHETLEKFEIGSKSLNMILANKDPIHRRDEIGFVSNTHQKPTIFVKGLTLYVSPRNKCNIYCKFRHYAHKCPFKRYSPHKLIWVPERTLNDSMQNDKLDRSINEEPKVKLVPKRKSPFL